MKTEVKHIDDLLDDIIEELEGIHSVLKRMRGVTSLDNIDMKICDMLYRLKN